MARRAMVGSRATDWRCLADEVIAGMELFADIGGEVLLECRPGKGDEGRVCERITASV